MLRVYNYVLQLIHMKIKIKYIKRFSLIGAIFLTIAINYSIFVRADDSIATSTANKNTGTGNNITTNFTSQFDNFISANNEVESISTQDIKAFTDKALANDLSGKVTMENLPPIDEGRIKILKQPYATLSESDRKEHEKADAQKYLSSLVYLIVSNAPQMLVTQDDENAFTTEFLDHFTALSDPNSSLDYFVDLGNRLELFINQSYDIDVPEKILSSHIKFLRLCKSLSDTLKGFSSISAGDPMSYLIASAKIVYYTQLFQEFFGDTALKNNFSL